MEAREYFEKEYGHKHIETVVEMQDWVSLYGLMDEFAEWKVKNCSIPDVSHQRELLLAFTNHLLKSGEMGDLDISDVDEFLKANNCA